MSLLRRVLLLATSLAPGKLFAVVPRNYSSYRIHGQGLAVHFLPNPMRAAGIASSVRLGIRRARFSAAILILPADLIELTPRDLARLLMRWRTNPGYLAATRIGDAAGIPLILPARLFPLAEALAGDVGLRELLARLPSKQRVLINLPSAAIDIDTRSDLAAARRRWRGRGN